MRVFFFYEGRIMSKRDEIINQAQSWLGLNGNDGSNRPIIDLYNSWTDGYKLSYQDAWCDCFVSACGIACGMSDIIGIQCYCPSHINWYKARGQWAGAGSVPQKGDVIFYDWESDDESDHVGFVAECDGYNITAIEGNKRNAVGYRNLTIDDPCIAGYGLPAYGEDPEEETYTFTFKDVYLGCEGHHVNLLQRLLMQEGFYKGKIDGSCGPETEKAIREYQAWKISQGADVGYGGADGWAGQSTWRTILDI